MSAPAPLMSVNMQLPVLATLSQKQLKVFHSLIHGSRRPTTHPEFLSLDVLGPGFASGGLAALLTTDEERELQQELFQMSDGFARLLSLLSEGNYALDLPENGALLVVAWLLEQGRDSEAQSIVKAIGPYMNEVKFVPNVLPAALPVKAFSASLGNVAHCRARLAAAERRGVTQVLARAQAVDVNMRLMDLQAQAVDVLLETLGAGTQPRQDFKTRSMVPDTCAYPFQQGLLSVASKDRARKIIKDITTDLKNPKASNRHRRSSSATNFLLRALNYELGWKIGSEEREILILPIRKIMASVLTRRGSWASEQYGAHMNNVRLSTQNDKRHVTARVLTERMAALQPYATVDTAALKSILAPITIMEAIRHHAEMSYDAKWTDDAEGTRGEQQGADVPRLKRCHLKAVKVAFEGSLSELLEQGAIVSAEDVGVVAHKLVATFRASAFADPRLTRLYGQIATAFSRRRSLLLISTPGAFQHQVRMSELPWVVPLLAELGSCAEREECGVRAAAYAGRLLGDYWQSFPITLMPNKVTSALRELLHPSGQRTSRSTGVAQPSRIACAALPNGTQVPRVVEELAADIFYGGFSSKFAEVACVAAARLVDTTYSRYYMIDTTLQMLINGSVEFKIAAADVAKQYYGNSTSTGFSVSANGKLIEAVQILTTHNLILADFLFADHEPNTTNTPSGPFVQLPLHRILGKAWTGLIQLMQTKRSADAPFHLRSQLARQIAHAVRQFVYFLSKLDSAAQLEFLDARLGRLDQVPHGLESIRAAVLGPLTSGDRVIVGWRVAAPPRTTLTVSASVWNAATATLAAVVPSANAANAVPPELGEAVPEVPKGIGSTLTRAVGSVLRNVFGFGQGNPTANNGQ